MKIRRKQIRSLMQVQYDLDQIALSNLNGEIAVLEKRILSSHVASRELERQALSGGLGCTAICQQLEAHERARQALLAKKSGLENARSSQRAKSAVSFAKWRVSKRLS